MAGTERGGNVIGTGGRLPIENPGYFPRQTYEHLAALDTESTFHYRFRTGRLKMQDQDNAGPGK